MTWGLMRLSDYANRYILSRDLAAGSVAQLRISAAQLDNFADGCALNELDATTVNLWAQHLDDIGRKPRTIKSKLGNVMTLLRAAAEDGLREPLNGRVRRIRVPDTPVVANTPEEMTRLLRAAHELSGWFEFGIRRADWWDCFLRLAWDTGFRLGDLLTLKSADLRPGGKVVKTQCKTGRVHVARLQSETLALLRTLEQQGEPRDEILPWPYCREWLYTQYRRLRKAAGVNGTAKFIRRGGATQVAKRDGDAAAARYLGQADLTGALARRHYIDRAQLDEHAPAPPALEAG